MVTITIPRLLARIAQLALDLDAADDPEMALAATEAAIAHFVTRMPSALYQPLCDAAKAAYGLPHGDRMARSVLREVAVFGDASEFEAGGGHPLAGVRFAFEADPERDPAAEEVLREFVEDVNAIGGVAEDAGGVLNLADDDWPDLVLTYEKACRVLGIEPLYAERFDDDEDLVCDECGNPMVVLDDGTTRHLLPGSEGLDEQDYDHDQDADHVAVAEVEEDDDDGTDDGR